MGTDRRHLRGYYIHRSAKNNVAIGEGGVVSVKSETKPNKRYTVNLSKVPVKCGCDDFLARRRNCKHIFAAIERLVSLGESPYDIPKYQVPAIAYQPPPWVTNVKSVGPKPYKTRSGEEDAA